jgi:hypothetical protein
MRVVIGSEWPLSAERHLRTLAGNALALQDFQISTNIRLCKVKLLS